MTESMGKQIRAGRQRSALTRERLAEALGAQHRHPPGGLAPGGMRDRPGLSPEPGGMPLRALAPAEDKTGGHTGPPISGRSGCEAPPWADAARSSPRGEDCFFLPLAIYSGMLSYDFPIKRRRFLSERRR